MDLHHLNDPALRLTTASLRLAEVPNDDWFDWLEAQGLGMSAPPQHRRASALAIVRALILEPPPAEHWPVLFEAARARGRMDLAEVFRLPEEPGAVLARPILDRELLEQGVGRRVALARRAPINMMERLVFDHEPRVIAALLDSPRIRTQEVLRLTTRRPLPLAVAREVLKSDKWSCEYPAIRSLARNETLIDRWGCALSLMLSQHDLNALARDPKATMARRRIARFRHLASRGALPNLEGDAIPVIELDPLSAED
jgi:hypothetical protein